MGFLISFAGQRHLSEGAGDPGRGGRELPLDRMLTETDSPFLPPQGRRGKRNEPAFVVEVAQALANVRNLAAEEIAAMTAANFRRFFRLRRSVALSTRAQHERFDQASRSSGAGRAKGPDVFRSPTLKGIFDLVRDDLVLVEQEIAAQNGDAIEPVAEISSYLCEGGGKRLRPALLLLAAGACGISRARARSGWARWWR